MAGCTIVHVIGPKAGVEPHGWLYNCTCNWAQLHVQLLQQLINSRKISRKLATISSRRRTNQLFAVSYKLDQDFFSRE